MDDVSDALALRDTGHLFDCCSPAWRPARCCWHCCEGVEFPAWWVVLLGIGACLFVWQFGLRAPRLGLISMERLPQIGLLLVFEPAVAASICAAASLTWPLVSRRYSQGSLEVAGLRADPQRLDDRADADARRAGVPGLWRPASARRTSRHGPAAPHRDGHDRAGGERRADDALLPLRRPRRAAHRHAQLCALGPDLRPGRRAGGGALQHRQHGGLRTVRGPDAAVSC